MGGTNTYRNRFPLPDNWNVEDTICLMIRVPNDMQYISMLRGLLESLTWQRSFALHPTEDAAYQVSKTWQNAFGEDPLTEGECMGAGVVLRFNPDTCKIETPSCDDPTVWIPIDSGSPGQGGAGYDPRLDPIPGDWPTPTVPRTDCIAASNLTEYLFAICEKIADWASVNSITDGSFAGGIVIVRQDILSVLYSIIADLINISQSVFWGVAFPGLISLDWGSLGSDLTTFDQAALECVIFENMNSDGTMETAGKDAVNDYITSHEADNEVYKLMAIYWEFIVCPQMYSYSTQWAGINEADCSGCGTFSHRFDFTIDQQGWDIAGNPSGGAYPCLTGYEGAYDTGVGFQPILDPTVSGSSDTRYRVCPMITFASREITSIEYEFTGTATFIALFNDPCTYTGVNSAEVTSPVTQGGLSTAYTSIMPMFCQNDDAHRLTAITVSGIGTDPF